MWKCWVECMGTDIFDYFSFFLCRPSFFFGRNILQTLTNHFRSETWHGMAWHGCDESYRNPLCCCVVPSNRFRSYVNELSQENYRNRKRPIQIRRTTSGDENNGRIDSRRPSLSAHRKRKSRKICFDCESNEKDLYFVCDCVRVCLRVCGDCGR